MELASRHNIVLEQMNSTAALHLHQPCSQLARQRPQVTRLPLHPRLAHLVLCAETKAQGMASSGDFVCAALLCARKNVVSWWASKGQQSAVIYMSHKNEGLRISNTHQQPTFDYA